MHHAPEKFDALIIGAGPAGAAVAIELARAGWSVALVEKQRFPRRKVCGECVAASNLPLLHHLGIGPAFDASAGPALRQVALLHGERKALASLPAAADERFSWGRALGRETLDGLLLAQARSAGTVVFQPCMVRSVLGSRGAWQCDARALDTNATLCLRASVLIDAHGSWEDMPSVRPPSRPVHRASDLFAFKANFTGAHLDEGVISVLALNGGYGGMVLADAGTTTIACCIRRDRLSALRSAALGECAGDVIEAWLARECVGVRQALDGARRDGAWLSSGPLAPGARIDVHDLVFKVGNAAGEAHPILGEGMSMALQSAALLSTHLLGSATERVPGAIVQAQLQRRYAQAWRKEFSLRLRVAAVFAHLAMRPDAAATLMHVVQAWPGLLTHGARWGGKVRRQNVQDTAAIPHALNPLAEKPT